MKVARHKTWIRRLIVSFSLIILFVPAHTEAETPNNPNILFIYLDDLGYGDVNCLNPDSKIPTPNIDRIAREGIHFTDAHCVGSVCGPSRYALLTGRYPWRRGKGGMGNGAKFRDLYMETDRPTLASLLKEKAYNTGQFGKWGLRHNYSDTVLPGRTPGDLDAYDFENNKLLGAQLVGFDYSWCISYLDKRDSNIKVQFENGSPLDPSLTPNEPYRWLPDSAEKIVEYLEVYGGKKRNDAFAIDSGNPFFIYWDPPSPHDPVVPNTPFLGKTDAGAYGDFVFEIDHYIGRFLDTLDQLNLAENTLVIFASDNGPDNSAYEHINEFNHYSMGERRGIKTDVFESGHRVPLIVRWPGFIEPGMRNDNLVSLTDWFATFADITQQTLPSNAPEDSLSFLPLLLGNPSTSPKRENMIHNSTKGAFALRSGNWLFIDDAAPPASEPDWYRRAKNVRPSKYPAQLYNLKDDPTQSVNLYERHPEKVQDMQQHLREATGKAQ